MKDPQSIVQNAYACFGRGDIPALLALLTDDVRWRFIGDRAAPYTGEVTGQSAVGEWFGQVAMADDVRAFEPRQFLAGPDHVTVIGWERTGAKPGGKEFDSDWIHVWQLRDGRIAGFTGMFDTEAAAAARG